MSNEMVSDDSKSITINVDGYNIVIIKPNEVKKKALDTFIQVLRELEQKRKLLNDDIEFYPSKYWSIDEPVYIGELKVKWQKGDPKPVMEGFFSSLDGLCRPLEPKKYGIYYVQLELCPNYRYWITTIKVNVYKKRI